MGWAAGCSSRETHSDSLTNVPRLTEMVATGDLGKGKELGREGRGQLRWRHSEDSFFQKAESRAKKRVAEGGGEGSSHLVASSLLKQDRPGTYVGCKVRGW